MVWRALSYKQKKKKKGLPNCADDSLFTESSALYSVVTGAFLEILGRILSKVLCLCVYYVHSSRIVIHRISQTLD